MFQSAARTGSILAWRSSCLLACVAVLNFVAGQRQSPQLAYLCVVILALSLFMQQAPLFPAFCMKNGELAVNFGSQPFTHCPAGFTGPLRRCAVILLLAARFTLSALYG